MRIKFIITIGLFLVVSSACKKKGCTDVKATNFNSAAEKDDGTCVYASNSVSEFTFIHGLNGNTFQFDAIAYPHPAGQNYSVQTLKYFVSNIVLYKASGDSVYIDVEHYIDANDPTTTTLEYSQSIENTSYTGIAFIFGLDASKNVTGAYINPPENLMEWPIPMGGGYHYMKMEGKYDSLGTIKNYNIHTGASMGNQYFFKVNLAQAFSVTNNEVHVELKMELNKYALR